METPDLVAALEQVLAEAKLTQQKLSDGFAVNGYTGLSRIRHLAGDALADARGENREPTAK